MLAFGNLLSFSFAFRTFDASLPVPLNFCNPFFPGGNLFLPPPQSGSESCHGDCSPKRSAANRERTPTPTPTRTRNRTAKNWEARTLRLKVTTRDLAQKIQAKKNMEIWKCLAEEKPASREAACGMYVLGAPKSRRKSL